MIGRRALVAGAFAAPLAVSTPASAGWLAAEDAGTSADNGTARLASRHVVRARRAYDAMQRFFYDEATGYYLETSPHTGENPWCYVWPYSQAMVATQDMAGIPEIGGRYRPAVAERYRVIEDYWNSETTPPGYDSYLRPPNGQGGDKFYDDNEWIGLGLVQRHHMAGTDLRRAAEIFDLVVFGWDTDQSHPCPGGVFWTQASWSQDRNTVSNAPGAELGLHLYLATGRPYYLKWATRMYDWTRTWMLASNGLYWDHVDLAGTIEKTQWSYNQGVMIGAGLLIYKATGQRRYLAQARETATKSLAFYAEDERYFTQPARFHAIFFANLLQLWTVTRDPAYLQAMRWYADESYERFADPDTGLYRFEGENPVQLLEQAGMVRIEAMLAWDPADYAKLT